MRVALIYSSATYKSFSQIREVFLSILGTKISEYYLDGKICLDPEGRQVTLHDIAIKNDVYFLDPRIPKQIQDNIHNYFEIQELSHIFGKTYKRLNVPHDFLLTKSTSIQVKDGEDIEYVIANLWKNVPHPILVRRQEGISGNISSIYDLRQHVIPALIQGHEMECVYQPKGRRLICTLIRNARGKKIYATPLFEKVSNSLHSRLISSSLPHQVKQDIITKLETFFSHCDMVPTLHVELTYTPNGLYLMYAAPVQHVASSKFPLTLHAIGMQPQELIKACLFTSSTK